MRLHLSITKKITGILAASVIALWVAPNFVVAAPAAAQLGPIWISADPTSGGTLSYQVNLTVTSPGTLKVRAEVRSQERNKKWKAKFADWISSQTVGVTTADSSLDGITLPIPTNFVGNASLRLRVYFNNRRIGKADILFAVNAPATAPAIPQTVWYDVGFNTNTVVSAEAVSTNGLTPPLTYAWSITDTDVRTNATFSSTTTNTPKFNTLPLTSFTNLLEITSGGTTNVLDPIDLEKEFDLATNPNLVGITSEQVTKSTYHLRVIVSDAGVNSVTGDVTVISGSPSPGQPGIPLGERQYFTAEPNGTNASTYSWSLTAKPTGSTAVLEKSTTRTPALRPDVEGDYTLQLTVSGGNATNTSFVEVRGATYVGVSACASCHGTSPQVGLQDYYTPWTQTRHATFFQRSIDGLTSDHYNESCISCHTVGYNKSPAATNGNFYAVQQELGWEFPTTLQYGNYTTVPTALKEVSNISCESCHGPGSQHPGEESTSLDVAVCATCHQDGNHHNRPKQWRLSPHGDDDNYLEASIEEATSSSCAKCHSPTSFVDYLKGKALTRLEAGRLTCQGCHDPHNEAMFPEEAHQVRIYDDVTLDDSVNSSNPPVLTGQGTSALCMFCHNSRRGPPPTYVSSGSNGTRVPHESTATDVLLGIRAQTNVMTVVAGVTNTLATVTLENSAHAGVAKCVDCHMHQADSNTVGDHTFSITDRLTGEQNLESCNQCHAGVDPVADIDHVSVVRSGFPGAGDYDGDGAVNGVQTEVDGVVNNLTNKMAATGMTFNPESGSIITSSYSTDPVIRAVQRNAAWNYWLINRELSRGVHNTAFTVRLLQWSYTVLSTNTAGNAYVTDFPNADLR